MRVLFVCTGNSCRSPMAERLARKLFPGSGHYRSAARQPAAAFNPAMVKFLEDHGISIDAGTRPAALDMTPLELTTLHVIVSLQGPVNAYLEKVPFHTTPLEWDLAALPAGTGSTDVVRIEELYRDLAVHIRDLMETLRGEGAP